MTTLGRSSSGLEEVVATSSALCFLDGARGTLAYCGYDIHDLVRGGATFEEVAYLLWHGRLPTRAELGDLESELVAARALPDGTSRLLRALPSGDAMDLLRTATSALAHYETDGTDRSPRAQYRRAVRLTSQIASVVAAIGRLAAGGGLIDPDPVIGHAANFLYMLTGDKPDATTARALDVALVLHADHELNASTFAARVASATLTDLHSAVVAAIGTLKGPLHGGANADVMRLLMEIGEQADPSRVTAVIEAKLARKEKIPGFGHRVYRTGDPRATHLREMSRAVGQRTGDLRWFEMSELIETTVRAARPSLYPNVDFYSASTYYGLGIPLELFTPVFAVSRVSGWTAHVLEQWSDNRLIRPRAEYTGAEVPRPYVPLAGR